MPSERQKIRWSPKLRQATIRELYLADARGVVDEDLIDKVGFALLARCHDLRMVLAGQVRCPACGRVFPVADTGVPPDEPVRCPGAGCTWWTTRQEYRQSWSKGDFNVYLAIPPVDAFIEGFGAASTARERIVLIDQLIHAFHRDSKTQAPVRALANNLIEGTHWDVVRFLDQLFLGLQTRPDADQAMQEWRRNVETMASMRACRPKGQAAEYTEDLE